MESIRVLCKKPNGKLYEEVFKGDILDDIRNFVCNNVDMCFKTISLIDRFMIFYDYEQDYDNCDLNLVVSVGKDNPHKKMIYGNIVIACYTRDNVELFKFNSLQNEDVEFLKLALDCSNFSTPLSQRERYESNCCFGCIISKYKRNHNCPLWCDEKNAPCVLLNDEICMKLFSNTQYKDLEKIKKLEAQFPYGVPLEEKYVEMDLLNDILKQEKKYAQKLILPKYIEYGIVQEGAKNGI